MTLPLICSCGTVTGNIDNATPSSGNRAVCCCDDCQTFADHLDNQSKTLDEFGGTEIYQTAIARVRIDSGAEHLRCLRLTPKGLTRWYTACCNTPIGNTINAGLPFVGVIHSFIDPGIDRDERLGPVRVYVQTQHARSTPNYPSSSAKFPIGFSLRIARQMLAWKLKGLGKPSAFYDDGGKPVVKPHVLNSAPLP